MQQGKVKCLEDDSQGKYGERLHVLLYGNVIGDGVRDPIVRTSLTGLFRWINVTLTILSVASAGLTI